MFDLPVHFNSEYIEFLTNSESIHSVYYSSTASLPSDARISDSLPTEALIIESLSNLPIKKYMTLNGRITDAIYYTEESIKNAVAELHRLYDANALTGIIILDFYYLNMLSKFGLSKSIEVIPSINHIVDSISKVNVVVNHIQSLDYKVSKIILDRGLNRDIEKFREISKYVRKLGLYVEVLVNEGCIHHCPYKFSHDSIISQTNSKLRSIKISQSEDLSHINKDYGCIKHFETNDQDILKIPFIRPEDLYYYEPDFDIIKISGKIKSNDFVFKVFKAYSERSWNGNLLGLLDATGGASHNLYVFNDMIPETFVKVLTSCQSKCHDCSYCDNLKVIQRLRVQKDYEFFT